MKVKISSFILLMFTALFVSTIVQANACETTKTCLQVSVNSQNGEPLAGMVVYLEPLSGQILTPTSAVVEVGQFDKEFTPYLNVSQAKTKVNFVNKDDITHHIYSANKQNKFSFKIRAGKADSSTSFNQVAEIAMGCNIHDWMSGYLLVVDTPLFAKTDTYGKVNFNISEKGDYRIVVWHPQMQAANNHMSSTKNIVSNVSVIFTLNEPMADIPKQESDDDFDFLSDY